MKSWFAAIALASAATVVTSPSCAASRLSALKHIKFDVRMDETGMNYTGKTDIPPASATLSSENDEVWQLTVSNCVLTIPLNGAKLTPDDAAYKASFEKGFAESNNPNQDELNFNGRAEVVRKLSEATEQALPCDSRRIYWVSILRIPRAPGNVAVMLTVIDGYRAQQTEQRVILFKPEILLEDDRRSAQDIGGATAAIARSLRP